MGLSIMRWRDLTARGGGRYWTISLVGVVTDERAEWAVRNRSVLDARFATLHEARETLEAVLAYDPLPEHWTNRVPVEKLRRDPDGARRFEVGGAKFIARRTPNGRWRVRMQDGTLIGDFLSLWHLSVNRRHFEEEAVRGSR